MYDFTSLSPYDFELLVSDLLSAELRVRLEVFTAGRDQGIDARYLVGSENELTVQSKHWRASGFSKLLAHLRDSELEKVEALKPVRYILVTSVPMTPDRKDKIYSLFGKYMAGPSDVVGPEDLNTFLRQYPCVERNHYKLWLSSTAVLQKIMHSDIHVATEHTIEEIQKKVALYVQTPAFGEALEILNENHACIIAGIPGVGKTMLGEMLLYALIEDGYQPVVLGQDISEATKLYVPDESQVFLYDDFLGQTALAEKLGKNEDARLSDFIRRVGQSRNKRFILTTREYILQQATGLYERLGNALSPELKYVLTVGSYSRFDKARILYNHLFFSELGAVAKQELLQDQAYLRIVDHRNYNPRLIEHMVSTAPTDLQPGGILQHFFGSLEHPDRLWEHAVTHQLDSVQRSLLFIMCSLPAEVRLRELVTAVQSHAGSEEPPYSSIEIKDALGVLEETFVALHMVSSGPTISFHNPSIRDFLLGKIDQEEMILEPLVKRAAFFEQIELLGRYGLSGTGWRGGATIEYPGVRAWFDANGQTIVRRLIDLFASPFCDYVRIRDNRGRTDLRPKGSLAKRLAEVVTLAEATNVDIATWLPTAIDRLAIGWNLGEGDREDWRSVVAATQDPENRAALLERAEVTHEWFFSEMYESADFVAYLDLAEGHSWWLPDDHEQIAKALFESFIPIELDWIRYDAEEAGDAYNSLEQLEVLADEFDMNIDGGSLDAARESILEMRDRDDMVEQDHYGPITVSSEESDIAGLFSTLLEGSE